MNKLTTLSTQITLFVYALSISLNIFANNQSIDDHQNFGDYSVHYAIFNSTFIQPDIAAIHGLKRSKYENIINFSVYKKDIEGTIPARISGSSKNLMQQLKELKIIEVKEENAVYYLVPFRISAKEILHFDFDVTPKGMEKPLKVKFIKTVYPE